MEWLFLQHGPGEPPVHPGAIRSTGRRGTFNGTGRQVHVKEATHIFKLHCSMSASSSTTCTRVGIKRILVNPQAFRTYYSHGLISSNITDKRFVSYSSVQYSRDFINGTIQMLYQMFLISVKVSSPLCCLESTPPQRIWRRIRSTFPPRVIRSETPDSRVLQPDTW